CVPPVWTRRYQPRGDRRAMTGSRSPRSAARVAAAIGLAFLLPSLTAPSAASAAEIRVMSTVALSATLDEFKPGFETATGHKVTMVYGLIAERRKRIQDGATAAVMILSRAALNDLQSQGKVASGSIVNLASSYLASALRRGAG